MGSETYSTEKCPTPGVTFAPHDRETLWLVRYNDGKYGGEVAITIGEHAERNARIITDALQAAANERLTKQEGE